MGFKKRVPIWKNEDVLKEIVQPVEISTEIIEPLKVTAEPVPDKDIEVVSGHAFSLNAEGQRIFDEVLMLYPQPILFIGGSGLGKSILARQLAKHVGRGYAGINADEGMDLSPLVGQWTPQPTEHGVTVDWNDGELTRSISEGGVFLFEEITRAPQEFLSRLFGLLDSDGRSWAIIEKDGKQIPISNSFWFIATGNPSGGQGYNTHKLDRALIERFSAIYPINEPLAPEREVLSNYVTDDLAGQIMKLAEDLRSKPETYVSTRGLVKIARHIKAGFEPVRAVEVAVANADMTKEGVVRRGVLELAKQHLVPVADETPIEVTEEQPVFEAELGNIPTSNASPRSNPQRGTGKRQHPYALGCVRHVNISDQHGYKQQGQQHIEWYCSCQTCKNWRGYGYRQTKHGAWVAVDKKTRKKLSPAEREVIDYGVNPAKFSSVPKFADAVRNAGKNYTEYVHGAAVLHGAPTRALADYQQNACKKIHKGYNHDQWMRAGNVEN